MLRPRYLLPVAAALAFVSLSESSSSADLIVVQGFETSGDTWSFTSNPTPYNTTGSSTVSGNADVWHEIQQFSQFGAYEGSSFWGMQDLENDMTGVNMDHTLTFETVDVSGYSDVTLSFAYQARGYGTDDMLAYELIYDGVSQGTTTLVTSTQWMIEMIAVPSNVSTIGLVLIANQNGQGGVAGWDNVSLTQTPEPATWMMLMSLTVLVGWIAVRRSGDLCRRRLHARL